MDTSLVSQLKSPPSLPVFSESKVPFFNLFDNVLKSPAGPINQELDQIISSAIEMIPQLKSDLKNILDTPAWSNTLSLNLSNYISRVKSGLEKAPTQQLLNYFLCQPLFFISQPLYHSRDDNTSDWNAKKDLAIESIDQLCNIINLYLQTMHRIVSLS